MCVMVRYDSFGIQIIEDPGIRVCHYVEKAMHDMRVLLHFFLSVLASHTIRTTEAATREGV